MARRPLEVADLIGAAGDALLERNRHGSSVGSTSRDRRPFSDVVAARIGGHLDERNRAW